MFSLKSFTSLFEDKKKQEPIVLANTSFMNSIRDIKNTSNENIKNSEDQFQSILNSGLRNMKLFSKTNEKRYLELASNDFVKALKLKQSRVEPHFYLAYILYLFDLKEQANKHLKIAEKINPSYKGLREVRELIYS